MATFQSSLDYLGHEIDVYCFSIHGKSHSDNPPWSPSSGGFTTLVWICALCLKEAPMVAAPSIAMVQSPHRIEPPYLPSWKHCEGSLSLPLLLIQPHKDVPPSIATQKCRGGSEIFNLCQEYISSWKMWVTFLGNIHWHVFLAGRNPQEVGGKRGIMASSNKMQQKVPQV